MRAQTKMHNSRVLVTGGCGAIGSEVINRLMTKHPDTTFINVDALTYAGNESNIETSSNCSANYKFVFGNICDERHMSYVLETERPEVIPSCSGDACRQQLWKQLPIHKDKHVGHACAVGVRAPIHVKPQ
jgi:FlaA1/EpsC-like NDP-sugar epimerase